MHSMSMESRMKDKQSEKIKNMINEGNFDACSEPRYTLSDLR